MKTLYLQTTNFINSKIDSHVAYSKFHDLEDLKKEKRNVMQLKSERKG